MFNAVSVLSLDTHGTNVKLELTRRWNMLESNEYVFRYKLNVTDSKLVGSKFKFFVQLNSDRTTKRRQPQQIQSLTPSFDGKAFNFNKINPEEVLLHITSDDDSINDVCCLVNNINEISFVVMPRYYRQSAADTDIRSGCVFGPTTAIFC